MDKSPGSSQRPGTALALPRRSLRRGTRSCAECKRRKTRCFFDRPTAATCVACQRRGMPCIGQEFMDVPLPDRGGEQSIVERLKWAEHILGTVAKNHSPDSTQSACLGLAAEKRIAQGRPGTPLVVDAPGTTTPITAQHGQIKHSEISNTLHAYLPSQEDADLLIGSGKAVLFVQAICHHYGGDFPPTSTLVTLPGVTAHPVILARKLLQLALCIQRLDPALERRVLNINMYPRDAMDTYFGLASNMVTCHDELLDSIEGLECLAYQGVYLVNSGSLRRALMCFRRAATLAQLMGLHRKVPYESLKQHDPATNVSLRAAWARIAYFERYLSLLLGMPTAISQVRLASASDGPFVAHNNPDWLESMQTDICERMIERNQDRNYGDLTMTETIDSQLNRMAKSMPEKWWAPLDLKQSENHQDVMMRVISAQMQILHYNLLVVLHLPYLLDKRDDTSRTEYSKTTCVYASREVLNRFIAFRSIVKVVSCCRLVDFCAFTAALTLLLTYLNSRKCNSELMLTHQRLGDRALIEAAMETMDTLHMLNNDGLSRKTAELTRKLLNLEANCAQGGQSYNTSADEEQQSNTAGSDETSFHIQIPYFGTVKIASDAAPRHAPAQSPQIVPAQYSTWSSSGLVPPVAAQNEGLSHQLLQVPHQIPSPSAQPIMSIQNEDGDLAMPELMASANDWAFQGVDAAFFDALFSGSATESGDRGSYMGSL